MNILTLSEIIIYTNKILIYALLKKKIETISFTYDTVHRNGGNGEKKAPIRCLEQRNHMSIYNTVVTNR